MDRNDPQTVQGANDVEITIKGVPATQTSAFRDLANERFGTYLLTAVNSTDYMLRMKPSDLIDLKRDTVQRTMDTIGNRIDQLGLAEKAVQQYGRAGADYEILVQLPGVDDPARVKELIGTAAVLEIDDVKDGPFASRDALLAAHGGVLPLGTKAAKSKPRGADEGEEWYLVSKTPVIMRPRHAQRARGPGRVPQVGDGLFAVAGRGQAIRALYRGEYRKPAGGGAGQPDCKRGHDSDRGSRIPAASRTWAAKRKPTTCRSTCGPARCRRASSTWKSARWGRRWARIRFARASWRASRDWWRWCS